MSNFRPLPAKRTEEWACGSNAKAASYRRLTTTFIAVACIGVAAWLIPEATRQLRADAAASITRGSHTRLGAPYAFTTRAEWNRALDALQRSVDIAPDDAGTQTDMSSLYSSASLRADIEPEQSHAYVLQALRHSQKAIDARPTEPRAWAELARAELLTGNASNKYVDAWQMAAQLGPRELNIQSQLLDLVLATYPEVHTSEMADWLRKLYINAEPYRQLQLIRAASEFDVELTGDGQLRSNSSSAVD